MNNELIEHPSWWKRNWKWAVPVGGCLTIIIVFIVVAVGGIYTLAQGVKEGSGHDAALKRAQENTQVIEALGTPIESDGFGSYNISFDNSIRTAHATIPIQGPEGEATIHVTTRGKGDDLIYEVLEVTITESGEIIDLQERIKD